jgi:hypothetical protein
LQVARNATHAATEREASFVTAATLWCNRDVSADSGLIGHLRRWPTDAYAVSLLIPTIASAGGGSGVAQRWPLLDELVPFYGRDEWWLTSMRAFARAEQLRCDEAEALALNALAARPSSGHAAHALAHVLYETGRHQEALNWLDRWMASDGARQMFRGHFAWHAALTELVTGDVDAARGRFDRDLANLRGNRSLIDAGSLLVRASIYGAGLGHDRADAVARAAGPDVRQPGSPFLAWNAALLAGIRADKGLLDVLEARATHFAGNSSTTAPAWCQVVFVCRAMTAVLCNDHAGAAALLARTGDTSAMGGSPAQRQIIDDLILHCRQHAARNTTSGLGTNPSGGPRT